MLPAPFVPQVRTPEIPESRTPAPGNSSQDTLRLTVPPILAGCMAYASYAPSTAHRGSIAGENADIRSGNDSRSERGQCEPGAPPW
jgi:hypothetical protein